MTTYAIHKQEANMMLIPNFVLQQRQHAPHNNQTPLASTASDQPALLSIRMCLHRRPPPHSHSFGTVAAWRVRASASTVCVPTSAVRDSSFQLSQHLPRPARRPHASRSHRGSAARIRPRSARATRLYLYVPAPYEHPLSSELSPAAR
jgi:hypothetical protein